MNTYRIFWYSIAVVFVVGAGIVAILYEVPQSQKSEEVHTLSFAEGSGAWWSHAQSRLAHERGIYTKHNISVEGFKVATGLEAKNMVVQGNADVGIVASTPLVDSAAKQEEVVVLGSYMQSSELLSLIIRKDIYDRWLEQPIGYVPGTISEFYLLSYLQAKDREDLYSSKKLNLVALTPPGIPPAFAKGGLGAVVIWEPFASAIREAEANQKSGAIVEAVPNLYTLRLYLITSKDVWERDREGVLAFARAFQEASHTIVENRDAIREEAEKYYNYVPGSLTEKWNSVNFSFSTDAADIRATLTKEAELARAAGIVDEIPDFSSMLSMLPEVAAALR